MTPHLLKIQIKFGRMFNYLYMSKTDLFRPSQWSELKEGAG